MMQIGMLWLDDSQRSLAEKVQRAATYYQEKYGRVPDFCAVPPQMSQETQKIDQIEIHPMRSVLPNHLWIGVQN
jgi:hypothetical protein